MSKGLMNPYLKTFWRTKADTKILKGGRASSKTWDIAGMAIWVAHNYTTKFLCMRQFQAKIQESVYAILIIRIEQFGLLDHFEILKSSIVHKTTGSSFHFYGIHRNIAEIKGFEGANIAWIEEAEGLTKEQWSTIEPTIRAEGAECWLSFNPQFVSDFIMTFKDDPENGTLVKEINYPDNPFLSDSMLRKIDRAKELDYEWFEHIYLGVPLSDSDKVIIPRKWIEASIDAHKLLGLEIAGDKEIGFDVADSGADKCATIERHGILATFGEQWKGLPDELFKSTKRVYDRALAIGADIRYDSIGVGAGTGSNIIEINDRRYEQQLPGKIKFTQFGAGGKVINGDLPYIDLVGYGTQEVLNKDFFSSNKSQAWWEVSDRFRNTYNLVKAHNEGAELPTFEDHELIAISSDIEGLADLVNELSTPFKDFDKLGRVKVESKEDLDKRGIKSPNYADAFIIAFAPKERTGLTMFDIEW